MIRLTQKNHRLSKGEKWLFATPLLFAGAVFLFFAVKRATSPRLISTDLQVHQVVDLGNNRLFTLQRIESKHNSTTFPVAVIYNTETGEKINEYALTNNIGNSSISPDGRFWLSGDISADYHVNAVVLRDLRDFSVVANFPTTGIVASQNFKWIDSRHFSRRTYENPNQRESLWKIDEKTGSVSKVRELDRKSSIVAVSRDGNWVVQKKTGKSFSRRIQVSRPLGQMEPYRQESKRYDNSINESELVSFPDEKISTKLPQYTSYYSAFDDDQRALWSFVHLQEGGMVNIKQDDFLKYDLRTRRTVAVRLKNLEKAFPGYSLASPRSTFSPNCRLWCAVSGQRWAFWNTETGELVKTIGTDKRDETFFPNLSPSFSKDSRLFFRPTKEGVEIYETSRFLP